MDKADKIGTQKLINHLNNTLIDTLIEQEYIQLFPLKENNHE